MATGENTKPAQTAATPTRQRVERDSAWNRKDRTRTRSYRAITHNSYPEENKQSQAPAPTKLKTVTVSFSIDHF